MNRAQTQAGAAQAGAVIYPNVPWPEPRNMTAPVYYLYHYLTIFPFQLSGYMLTAPFRSGRSNADVRASGGVPLSSKGNASIVLAPTMHLVCTDKSGCDVLACAEDGVVAKGLQRYSLIFSPPHAPPPEESETVVTTVEVCIRNASELLGPDM